ncbi:hypothetical protein [Microbacterium hydrocarbonoxydans]|uniref:hypothetical protein n=1 Tax=Microbacterium hydrocarbonoxydans TaxID=273678 RepID=UPI0020404E82|nr:hypothetical protein [Microbacterium hydrocarbonoxydans]MCM3778401.1 hypothetical protein [Microbacterium hydrocarbonoxydans]
MKTQSGIRIACTAGALALSVAVAPAIAHANAASSLDDLADVIGDAELIAVGAPSPSTVAPPALESEAGGTFVSLDAVDLDVTLGVSSHAENSPVDQYAVAVEESVTYAVSLPEEGATRFSAVIAEQSAQSPEWTFGSGTQLLLLDDGSVSVSDARGFIAGIESPWAVDAAGRSLDTHYEISGSTLTQVVDTTGATFPVVADPTVQFFGPYIQVHLNKTESRAAITGYAACAGILSKSPVPFAKLLQVACTTVTAIGAAQLVGNRCVSIHYVVGVGGPAGVWWPWVRDC